MKKLYENRIIGRRGFTLAETLLAVLILLLSSAIVAAGIPAAKSAYEKVVLASNAEVLLSTAMSSLRNELGTAIIDRDNSVNNTIRYLNNNRGIYFKLYLDGVDPKEEEPEDGSPKTIWIKTDDGDLGVDSEPFRLVSKEASTGDLYVTYNSVTYNGNLITFNELCVKRESGKNVLTKVDSFSIRNIS